MKRLMFLLAVACCAIAIVAISTSSTTMNDFAKTANLDEGIMAATITPQLTTAQATMDAKYDGKKIAKNDNTAITTALAISKVAINESGGTPKLLVAGSSNTATTQTANIAEEPAGGPLKMMTSSPATCALL